MSSALLGRRALPRLARNLTRANSGIAKPPVTKSTSSATPTVNQAPNAAATWSTNQNPRPHQHSGPRFEQTDMSLQPNPPSAMAMIAEEPVRVVLGRKAVCDGGGGPLGHPKIFINLDQPGAHACGYCGIRFEQAPHHGHEH